MDKNVAIRIMQFLDKVATTGHKERMEMNTCVDALVQIANQPDPEGKQGAVDGGDSKGPGKKQPPRPRKPAAKKAAPRKGKAA